MMTLRPLDFAFLAMSDLSKRTPWSIGEDEQEAELRDEIGRRRDCYPGFVVKGRLTQGEADRHIAVLGEILADCTPVDPARPFAVRRRLDDEARARRAVAGVTWEDKVRELRRELAIRRASYPGLIDKGRATIGDARERMERIEAVHWRYWIDGFTWDEPLCARLPADVAAVRAECRAFIVGRSTWLLEAIAAGAPWGYRIVDECPRDGLPPGTWWRGTIADREREAAAWRAQQPPLDSAA